MRRARHCNNSGDNPLAAIYRLGVPPEDGSAISNHLASNVRHVREQRGLTQQQLAKLCEMPRSTVANIESGVANPTLAVLGKLAGALQLSVEELISAPRARLELVRAADVPKQLRARGRAIVHKLLPHPIPGMEIDRLTIEPGSQLRGVPHRPGTQEYLYCERGAVTLRVQGERLVLAEGDVAAFGGDQPHSYENPGTVLSVAFSVVTLAPLG